MAVYVDLEELIKHIQIDIVDAYEVKQKYIEVARKLPQLHDSGWKFGGNDMTGYAYECPCCGGQLTTRTHNQYFCPYCGELVGATNILHDLSEGDVIHVRMLPLRK